MYGLCERGERTGEFGEGERSSRFERQFVVSTERDAAPPILHNCNSTYGSTVHNRDCASCSTAQKVLSVVTLKVYDGRIFRVVQFYTTKVYAR